MRYHTCGSDEHLQAQCPKRHSSGSTGPPIHAFTVPVPDDEEDTQTVTSPSTSSWFVALTVVSPSMSSRVVAPTPTDTSAEGAPQEAASPRQVEGSVPSTPWGPRQVEGSAPSTPWGRGQVEGSEPSTPWPAPDDPVWSGDPWHHEEGAGFTEPTGTILPQQQNPCQSAPPLLWGVSKPNGGVVNETSQCR